MANKTFTSALSDYFDARINHYHSTKADSDETSEYIEQLRNTVHSTEQVLNDIALTGQRSGAKYYSTKHYGHNIGLSAVFRQPRAAHSHCHLLHGYSLAFTFTFGCDELDDKNWAVDFGGLKPLKAWLEDKFDHKLCLDSADPYLSKFQELAALDLAEIRIFDGVGTEKFAKHAFKFADQLIRSNTNNRCYCVRVECAEHGANSAIYEV